MGALVMAWLVGEGIIVFRSVRDQGGPPWPGTLMVSSGLFVLLALLSEAPNGRQLAVPLAWGFDIAAFMGLSQTAPGKGQKGWWQNATSRQIPNTQILPGGAQISQAGYVNPTSGTSASSGSSGTTPTPTAPAPRPPTIV